MSNWPKNLKQPLYVRPSSRVRYMGKNYIVKRDVTGAIYTIVGRMTRKLPSLKEAIVAATNQKLICQWGAYYSIYVQVDVEEQPLMLEYLWTEERKRGIQPPDVTQKIVLSDEG
ncbi:hypothetical protein KJZ99_03115 [bacterium]|nr:hypothetical protein [bacterium]